MRLISLREDSPVFRQRVNRTLYMLFKDKNEDFFEMLSDQTPTFWVGFTITLREVLRKNHYLVSVLRTTTNYADRFFIFLHDMLIENKREKIMTYVNDVVAMARYNKFINCLEATVPGCHDIGKEEIDGMISFERLFGDRKKMSSQDKVFPTHMLHLHSVGSLLTVFRHWLMAEKSDQIDWAVPPLWLEEDDMLPFYAHLKKRWGQSLLSKFPTKVQIAWWNCSSVVEYNRIVNCSYTELKDPESGLRKLELYDMCRKMLLWNIHTNSKIKNVSNPTMFIWQVCVCQVYISDDTILFHPYAQFPSCVFAEAVGPWVWLLEAGAEVLLSKNSLEGLEAVQAAVIDIVNVHVEVKKAMQLDASFHDSVATHTTWTSEDTLARLLWNMPLCIKWLEMVLVQTYRFEGSLRTFCHFPVRRKVAGVLEKMHSTLSHEPRLLAKAAIIVAEKIWMAEKAEKTGKIVNSCRNPRALLKFCLERLTPKMKYFNNGRCFKLLKFVMEKGWTLEEQLSGQISSNARKSDFRSIRDGSAADINIDFCFSRNYRSSNYWFNFRDQHNLHFNEKQYEEALTKIATYQKAIENPPDLDQKKTRGFLKYDLQYYQSFKNGMRNL